MEFVLKAGEDDLLLFVVEKTATIFALSVLVSDVGVDAFKDVCVPLKEQYLNILIVRLDWNFRLSHSIILNIDNFDKAIDCGRKHH